jgi:hypothetical protein
MIKKTLASLLSILLITVSCGFAANVSTEPANYGNFTLEGNCTISNSTFVGNCTTFTESDVIVETTVLNPENLISFEILGGLLDYYIVDLSNYTEEDEIDLVSLEEAANTTDSIVIVQDPLNGTYSFIDTNANATPCDTTGCNDNSTPCNDSSCNDNSTIINPIGDNSTIIDIIGNNSTIVTTDGFAYPNMTQLISFIGTDTTDMAGLSDSESTMQLALSATNTYKFHNQIVLLIFSNGQTFAVNRFILSDGSFVYVDCSKPYGMSTVSQNIDRVLSLEEGKPIVATSLYQNGVTYTYPPVAVSSCIALWNV